MPSLRSLCFLLAGLISTNVHAEEPIRLREEFSQGALFHVNTRVELTGSLTLPPGKDESTAKAMAIAGSSVIEYDERIHEKSADGLVSKTVRLYGRMDFQRKMGNQPQQSNLRPSVRRLVVLRKQNTEVPFSPDGPLTWGEIDLVRTDVFTPALAGLLPDRPMQLGERWTAGTGAVQELTDLERIEEGRIECRFETLTSLEQRRYARIALTGTVRGVNEDGPSKQTLEGYFLFDLESNHLSYLSLKGISELLDKDGKLTGRVEGRFVLTRQAYQRCVELGDEALRGVVLEPNDDNTLLLYENPQLGLRFLHPRRWRIGGVKGTQVGLDESGGSGLLLTVEPPGQATTGAQYLAETRTWLQQQKAQIFRIGDLQRQQAGQSEITYFTIDASVNGQRAVLEYCVVRQGASGLTVAARLLPDQAAVLKKDVERIVRSLQVDGSRK